MIKTLFIAIRTIICGGGVFIDGGSLDLGDTLQFIKLNPQFEKVYAFEPNPLNYEKCQARWVDILHGDSRIEIVNKGLWNREMQLNFRLNGGASRIVSGGTNTIDVTSIDKFIKGEIQISFIKMDIEGSELEALEGAKETIVKDKPDLAICIYHKNEDIIDIPNYILKLNPEYKFYIRHYSCYNTETVLYAVMR